MQAEADRIRESLERLKETPSNSDAALVMSLSQRLQKLWQDSLEEANTARKVGPIGILLHPFYRYNQGHLMWQVAQRAVLRQLVGDLSHRARGGRSRAMKEARGEGDDNSDQGIQTQGDIVVQ
jgi:hypothetical protein